MSNIPTVEKSFETLLNIIISLKPPEREAKVKPLIQNFLSHTIIQQLLNKGQPPAQKAASSTTPPLADIQKTLAALTKALAGIQKPSTTPNKQSSQAPQKGKGTTPTPTRTYSAVAGTRPPNPSLVVDLAHLGIAAKDQVRPEILCDAINKKLITISPPQATLAAVRWTAKGNLVATGNHMATSHTLQNAAPHISSTITAILKLPSDTIKSQPRPNVKWSKLLINGVPTGALKNSPAFSPERCHQALAASNPSYASLNITLKPSWVRPPTSYPPGAISSLSVAFEDPDGNRLKALLAERYLYAYGNRCSVKKWKQRKPINKDKANSNTAAHDQGDDSPGEEDADTHPTPNAPPQTASAPPQSLTQTRKSARTARPTRPFEA